MAFNFLSNTNIYNKWSPTTNELYKISDGDSEKIVRCTEIKNNICKMMIVDENEIEDGIGGWLIDIKTVPIYELDEYDINNIRYKRLKNILNKN